jgi:hypothetical protein
MPEEHAEYTRHGEDQREAKEVPLLAEPVDICVAKQFHEKTSC